MLPLLLIEGEHAVVQALLGTLLTWGLTALGASMVVFTGIKCCGPTGLNRLLDTCLGFAGGVMIAASFWSLLSPALDEAAEVSYWGESLAFIPVAIGFGLGFYGMHFVDMMIPLHQTEAMLIEYQRERNPDMHKLGSESSIEDDGGASSYESSSASSASSSSSRFGSSSASASSVESGSASNQWSRSDRRARLQKELRDSLSHEDGFKKTPESWRRTMLLVFAITLHNLPEGLAVGVAFGAIGSTPSATFNSAVALAIGIGIQNFPEGLAVSLPLRREGYTLFKSFLWGQFSGMVEPLGGVLGAGIITVAEPVLPYALAFAAGAMIFVVVEDLIPEAMAGDHRKWASSGAGLGFIVMMCLDVGLSAL